MQQAHKMRWGTHREITSGIIRRNQNRDFQGAYTLSGGYRANLG